MNSDLIMKKSYKNEDDEETVFDVVLDLYTKILRKDDSEKCICSNKIPEIDNINVFYEKEIVPNIRVNDQQGKFKINEMITSLKMCGYPLTGAMLSIYIKDSNDYVFLGSDPLESNIFLEISSFENKIIKIRAICYIEEKYLSSNFNVVGKKDVNLNLRFARTDSLLDKSRSKRTKERKIGYIIEKVNNWRKLYNGFNDEYGRFTKFSLDEAARLIGISKKSLDDYLLQLRLGRKFGFDFNANKTSKVGVLRSFVKTHRNLKTE